VGATISRMADSHDPNIPFIEEAMSRESIYSDTE